MTRTDALVCIILIVCLIGLVVGFFLRTSKAADRIACGANLSRIGKALLLYTNDQKNGSYPRGLHDSETARFPVVATPYDLDPTLDADAAADPFAAGRRSTPRANDVIASIYLLLRTQDLDSKSLVCPATDQTPLSDHWAGRPAGQWTNWPGVTAASKHLSYSVQNPYWTKKSQERSWQHGGGLSGSEFAVAADLNPGVNELLTINTSATSFAVQRVNSRNHGGDGQNVLFQDGHVEWLQNPFVGVARDNIYTRGRRYPSTGPATEWEQNAAVVGPPYDETEDSVLLPNAKQLGRW